VLSENDVLIREEDLLTNRTITHLLSEENNFRVFSELLASGLVKVLRLPLEMYPQGRKFDPVRLPTSARVEEHQLRRSYKGKLWKTTSREWQLRQSNCYRLTALLKVRSIGHRQIACS
jgi:hypothetical protein